jgi:hypothetical protein
MNEAGGRSLLTWSFSISIWSKKTHSPRWFLGEEHRDFLLAVGNFFCWLRSREGQITCHRVGHEITSHVTELAMRSDHRWPFWQ